ncbi:MAG: interleukin-like EMT inducer domain-containing protein, partial [Candidatus Omnitrophota bacterium]
MILPRNLKMLFRTISAFVAGIFLFQQISWAGDLAGRMTDATLKRLDAEQAQTFAPDYLQNQQALHQDLVNLNQDIEDYNNTILSAPSDGAGTGSEPVNDPVELKGPMGSSIIAIPDPIFDFPNVKGCLEDLLSPENGEAGGALMSVTTQSGDIIHYKQDGRIDYIETVSDPVIRLIRGLSVEDGVLMEAVIEYRDGTIQEIGRSKTVRATLPDGTILYYDEEGLVRYVFYPDGALAVCEDNVPDSDGEPVRILKEYSKDGYSGITPSSISILNDPKRTLYYNLNNRLKRVKFNSGKTIYYDDGILSRVETEDGLTYIYESEEGVSPEGDAEYTVRLSEVINVFGRTYRLDDGSIIEVMVSSEGGTDTYRFVDGFEGNPDNGITCADFDGNGFDDILVDFGQGHGLWVKYDNVYWQRLHELSPQSVTAGDFDGDGRKEIIADFGEGHGIHMCDYKPDSTYQWSQVHPESPESITPIDLNSDGKDEIIFDYSQYGVWTWDQDQWVRINETSCGQVVTVDLDGDGKDEVIFDYDQYGVYTWDPDRQDPWTQINATSCDQIITADIDGDGKDEAIFNYSQYGVWTWDQERQDQWIQINVTSCDRMVAADIDGDGKDEAIFDYSQYGVYTWDPDNATPWWQINVTSPDKISVLDFDGDGKDEAIFDYVQCGIYTWNNDDINPWFQINSVNSLSITVANLDNNGKDDVVIDFGSPYCTYINFDVSNWYQLHSLSPKSLCPADDQTAYACMDTSRADDFYYWYGSPGEMFDGMGNLRADYDYTDLPYFDTIIYGGDRRVRETRNPDGTIADLSENILPLKSFDELFSGAVMLPQGRTLSVTKPDGTIFYYNTEAASDLVESVVYPDGSVTTYEYNVKDADGEAVTVLYDSDKTSYYTAAGRLKRVEFNSGKVIRYDDGVILEVIGDESGDYYFDIAQETDGIYSRLKTFIDRDGYRLDFGSTVTSLSIITPSGAKITYGEDESVIEILIEDPDGRTARYDAAGNLVSVEEGGLIVTGTDIDEAEDTFDELTLALYAAYGDLNQAQSDYYQKYFIWQDAYNKLKRLTFWERLFNKSLVKKRTNAEIEARDARDKAYSELQAASGVVTNLSNEKQTAQMNLNALRSVFEKFPSNIAENDCWEDLADIDLAAFKAKLRFTAVIYDEEREIRRVLDPDGNLITAANDGLPTAGLGDSSYLIRNNGLGNIDQISVCRDRIQRIYDASGMLKSLELDENTKVIYKDGEVAEVYKTIPETGKKVTIKDFGYDTATAEKKLIEYAVYQDDGSKILYKNDVIDSKITTEGNIIRYASERIDTVEEPDGKVYKYIYGEDPDDNIRKELIQYILSDGTVIKLTGGVITGATLTNGLELIDPVFDDTGNILSAECLLEGGAIGTIKYGVLEKATLPDQAEIYYKDGLIHTVVKPDGSILAYSYTLDDDLNITGTIVEMMGMTYCYDENGILQQAETADYTAGYTDGMLTSIDMPYQNISITDATFGAGYEVIGGAVHLADDWTYHLKDGELEYVTMPNGADVTFDADNRYITRIEQKGVIETYAYNRDVSGRLLSANVTHNRSGEFVTEDIGVYLASITDPTWQIIADRLPCDHFGDIYSTYLRSDFGNIEVKHYGPLIPMPGDSDVRIAINYNVLPETTYMYAYEYSFYLNTEYPDSLVYLAIRKDAATTGSAPITIDFYNHYTSLRDYSFSLSDVSSEWEDMTLYLGGNTDNPKIVRYTIPCDDDAARSGSIYIAHMAAMAIKEYDISTDWKDDLIPDEIMKPFFDADISLPFADSYLRSISFSAQVPISEFYGSTPLYAVYDKNDKLLELKRTEGSILTFGDTGPEGWTWTDENGIDCKIEYEYDGFTVTKALLFPEPGLTEPDAVLEYKDGRIYRATKAGAVYSYEYPVDAEGAEFVEITNDSTKYVYLYKDGKITSNTSDEGLVTDYIYNGERISSSRVTFEGAVVETFTYEYADGLTIVIDEQGVRRTYDNSNTLIFLETAEGLGYRYNYGEDDEGNDVLEVDLYQAAGDNGIIVYHKEGNIDSIQLKDGTIININDSENPEALQDITFKDGLVDTVTYETGEVAKYIRDEYGRLETIEVKSGLATRWYNPEGELIKSQENPNEYYLYGYTRTETGAIEYVEVQKVTVDEICGAALPARVYAFSAGYFDGWDAGIIVNDKGESAFNTNFWHQANNEQYTGCGWDVVVIDDETGTVLKKGFFNVNHLGEGEAERMADFINSVSDGDFVAATVGDEGWYHLTESAKRALESIGSARIRE